MPVPGWRLRISLAASMPFALEVRGHADVADDHVWCGGSRAGDERVVVLGDPDDLDVGVACNIALTPSRMMTLSSARNTVIAPTAASNQSAARRSRAPPCVGRWCQPHPRNACQSTGGTTERRSRSAQQRRSTGRLPMRIESSVTSVSWIPSEAVTGVTKGAFETGFAHYDDAPPDDIGPDIAGRRGTAGSGPVPLRQPSRRLRRVRRRRRGRRRRLRRWRRDRRRPRSGSARSFTVAAVSLPDRQPSRRSATAGCGSRRRPAAAPAFRRRGRCAGRRSCSTSRRSCGRRWS